MGHLCKLECSLPDLVRRGCLHTHRTVRNYREAAIGSSSASFGLMHKDRSAHVQPARAPWLTTWQGLCLMLVRCRSQVTAENAGSGEVLHKLNMSAAWQLSRQVQCMHTNPGPACSTYARIAGIAALAKQHTVHAKMCLQLLLCDLRKVSEPP